MVLSTLRSCADRTTIPPTRSEPCARCSRLNHSQSASAGSARRLFIAAATGIRFADMISRWPPRSYTLITQEAEGVPRLPPQKASKKRPESLDLAKLAHCSGERMFNVDLPHCRAAASEMKHADQGNEPS